MIIGVMGFAWDRPFHAQLVFHEVKTVNDAWSSNCNHLPQQLTVMSINTSYSPPPVGKSTRKRNVGIHPIGFIATVIAWCIGVSYKTCVVYENHVIINANGICILVLCSTYLERSYGDSFCFTANTMAHTCSLVRLALSKTWYRKTQH